MILPTELNSQNYQDFENSLITLLGEKISENSKNLKIFHDEFLSSAQTLLATIYDESDYDVKSLLSKADFPTELDKLIDDILTVNKELRKAIQQKSVKTPPEWQEAWKEGLQKAEEIKLSAKATPKTIQSLMPVIQQHIHNLTPESAQALAEISAAISIVHPEIIPDVVHVVAHADHPNPSQPPSATEILDIAHPIAISLLEDAPNTSAGHNLANTYQEQALATFSQYGITSDPNTINKVVGANLIKAPATYYPLIVDQGQPIQSISQANLEKVAIELAQNSPDTAKEILAQDVGPDVASNIVNSAESKISELQTTALIPQIPSTETDLISPDVLSAVSLAAVDSLNLTSLTPDQKQNLTQTVQELITDSTSSPDIITQTLTNQPISSTQATDLTQAIYNAKSVTQHAKDPLVAAAATIVLSTASKPFTPDQREQVLQIASNTVSTPETTTADIQNFFTPVKLTSSSATAIETTSWEVYRSPSSASSHASTIASIAIATGISSQTLSSNPQLLDKIRQIDFIPASDRPEFLNSQIIPSFRDITPSFTPKAASLMQESLLSPPSLSNQINFSFKAAEISDQVLNSPQYKQDLHASVQDYYSGKPDAANSLLQKYQSNTNNPTSSTNHSLSESINNSFLPVFTPLSPVIVSSAIIGKSYLSNHISTSNSQIYEHFDHALRFSSTSAPVAITGTDSEKFSTALKISQTSQTDILNSTKYQDYVALQLRSLPSATTLDNQTIKDIANIWVHNPNSQDAIHRISQLPTIQSRSTAESPADQLARHIYEEVKPVIGRPIQYSSDQIKQIAQAAQESLKLNNLKDRDIYIQRNLLQILPITPETARNKSHQLTQIASKSPLNTRQAYSALMSSQPNLSNLSQSLSKIPAQKISSTELADIIISNRLSSDSGLANVLANKSDIAIFISTTKDINQRNIVLSEALLMQGASAQTIARLTPKDFRQLNLAFDRLLPTATSTSLKNPEFAVSLLTQYTYNKPEVKQAIETVFRNPQNYDLALRRFLGSPLSTEFKKQRLDEAIVLLSQAAISEQQRLGLVGPHPDHIPVYSDMAMKYLSDSNPKIKNAINQAQTLINQNRLTFRNLLNIGNQDYISNLANPRYLPNIQNTVSASNEFFKFITTPTRFLNQAGQFINTPWLQSLRLSTRYPTVNNLLTRFIPPTQLTQFNNLIAQFNSVNPYLQAITNPIGFAQNRLLGLIAKSPAGKAVGALLAKTGLKKAITALSTALPLPPGISNAVGWIAGEIISRVGGFIKKHAPVLIAAVAGLGGFIASGSLLVAAGSAIVGFLGSTALIGGPAAASSVVGASVAIVLGVFGTAVAIVATNFLIIVTSLPIAIAFFLFIINNSAYIVPPGYLLQNGPNGNFDVPVIPGTAAVGTCPIKDGKTGCGSYSSPTARSCHGTNSYWGGNSQGACGYSIPLDSPSKLNGGRCQYNNIPGSVCFRATSTCSTYGYAADVPPPKASPYEGVYLPFLQNDSGQVVSRTWTRVTNKISIFGGSWGYGVFYRTSDGLSPAYEMYFGHIANSSSVPANGKSGDNIGSLYVGPGFGTHLHIEMKQNGVDVVPDPLCQGKVQ